MHGYLVVAAKLMIAASLFAQQMPPSVPLPEPLPQLTAQQQLVRRQAELFKKLDRSADGRISVDELLVDVPIEKKATQIHRLCICDFDGSGDLTFHEWRMHWAFERPWNRDALPDFVSGSAVRAINALLPLATNADVDGNGRLTVAEWQSMRAPSEFPSWISLQQFTDWDFDSDEEVTLEEVRQRLEMLYGIRTRDGILLRDGGRVVLWRSLIRWDTNRDRELSKSEFVAGYWAEDEKSQVLFDRADRNLDGNLSFAEAVEHGIVHLDVLRRFESLDQGAGAGSGDGQLSLEELRKNLPQWQRGHLTTYFRAADENKTDRISLREFLSSPWGMTLGEWFHPFKDTDGDQSLSWDEFWTQCCIPDMAPEDRVLVTGQARILFELLQLEPDEKLTLQEFPFDRSPSNVPVKAVAQPLDADADGIVTFVEAFEIQGTVPSVPMLSWFPELFSSVDTNQDGQLTSIELESALHFQRVAAEWQRIAGRQWEQFRAADFDGNGEVSNTELGVAKGEQHAAKSSHLVSLLDFDQSGGLSFEEYLCLPGHGTPEVRGPLPDHVRELALSLLAEWQEQLRLFDEDRDGQWSSTEWRHRTDFQLPGPLRHMLPPFDLGELDTNYDRIVTAAELRAGLEVLLGIRSKLQGPLLRRPGGMRFSFTRFANALDPKLEGLSYAIVIKRGDLSTADQQNWCKRYDRNADHLLTMEELLEGDQFWFDPLPEFIRLDADLNTQLSVEELTRAPKAWYQSYVKSLIPAFDLNGDGSLSLSEFLACPVSNPMGLSDEIIDVDGDGLLQASEFLDGCEKVGDYAGLGQGYLVWAFARWDQDQSGGISLDERRFRLPLTRVSTELVFRYFDENADGQLTVEEAVRRRPPPGGEESVEWVGFQKHSSRVEETFLTADSNFDRLLNWQEFQAFPQLAVAMVPGRKLVAEGPAIHSLMVASSAQRLTFRAWMLIAFNVVLLTGLGWLLIRR